MMSTRSRRGKEAITRWEVRERFNIATLLDVSIETGRTHQIRVHLNAIGHPVLGDPLYGKGKCPREIQDRQWKVQLKKLHRQALHAKTLRFHHPVLNVDMEYTSPLPSDMADLCDFLRNDGRQGASCIR
jgi:23S rRNA pseudouridine1911/1915/1917 synthase